MFAAISNPIAIALLVSVPTGLVVYGLFTAAGLNKRHNDRLRRQPVLQSISDVRLFMSYRRADSSDISGRIYDRLKGAFGHANVFRDVDSVPLGTDFRGHVDAILARCEVMLAVIGDQWTSSTTPDGQKRLEDPNDLVRLEIEAAIRRTIPVIAVLVSGARLPTGAELPVSMVGLTSLEPIAVRSGSDFHRDIDRLIQGIRQMTMR
jgi:hypothetical protein